MRRWEKTAWLTGIRRVSSVLVVLLALIVVTGCGETENTSEAQTVTAVETAPPAAPPETVTVVETAPAAPAPDPDPEPTSGQISVPDVVGLDHQLAQDTMQASGLYILLEEDATGAGRMLLWDRNWTVVSQDPPAGTMVSEDQAITLRSKKEGE